MPDYEIRDEDTPYGPVPDEVRQPARHWDPLRRPLPSRPMPDLRPARQDPKALNRSTEKPNRATGAENRALKKNSDIPPLAERLKVPPFEEQMKEIDEEESNLLNPLDGYVKPPARPRKGFGLKLRPQHEDINEYFTGPKWHDDRPSLETAESRGLTPPIGPWIERPVRHREVGEELRRPEPPKPPPPSPTTPPQIFTAKNLLFKRFTRMDDWLGKPPEFAGPDAMIEIRHVREILRQHPDLYVDIRASVGLDPYSPFVPNAEWTNKVMEGRGNAVSKALEDMGIDPARMQIAHGDVGTGEANRKVEFRFFAPRVKPRP
jgi:hypothetical protein